MDINEILRHCDHTLLKPDASARDIISMLDDAKEFRTASACIPPCYVRMAKDYVGASLKICTVIGFPLGYSSTETKVFETMQAIGDGADEIDMVINVGALKEGRDSYVREEIGRLKGVCDKRSRELGRKIILKVIIEACLLNTKEKIRICKIITEEGADYIKTSTGFSSGGATEEDILLFKEYIGENVKIKAAGGISTLEQAARFIELGCDRIGTSRIVNIAKGLK